ncbi:hypothetical protein V8F33_006703 [Rhypophila sp. PSN 637]
MGKLAFLYRDKKYYRAIKIAHAFADHYVEKAVEYRKCRVDAVGDKASAFKTRPRIEAGLFSCTTCPWRQTTAWTCGTKTYMYSWLVTNQALSALVMPFSNSAVIQVNGGSTPTVSRCEPSTRKAYDYTILPTGGSPLQNLAVFIKKGTILVTSVYALHRVGAPCWGPDPEDFRSERMCPAKQLAETEIAYTLARLAQTYERIECRDKVQEWVKI